MSDIKYEPTREFWTPYEPWMRDVLADDTRVSWSRKNPANGDVRSAWGRVAVDSDIGRNPSGYDLRIHPDDVPERPTEADPDEALAVVIDKLVDEHGSTSEWADNEYITRSTALAIARAAREHIAQEPDEALWEEWERLCRKAEAERDEALAEAEGRIADLRAGIVHARWSAEVNESNDTRTLHALLDDLADLLNPPTEGDDHE